MPSPVEMNASVLSPFTSEHPLYEQMETTQKRVDPYLEELPELNTQPHLNLDNRTSAAYEEIIDLSGEIRSAKGMEPLDRGSTIRSLHALLVRIAELSEKHLFHRREKAHDKQEEVRKGNETIANWTRRQGYANFGSGVAYPLLLVLGGLIGEPVASALKLGRDLIPGAGRGLENWFESLKQPSQFGQSLYMQTVSSDRQALEGLKNLPRELQQKLMQMLRQELEAIRATGQR